MLARRSNIDISYRGINVTSDIAKDLLSFEYTDNASGTSDSITISLKDDQKKWISSWAPQQGDSIRASIITNNWRREGDNQQLKCGAFMVDEPEYSGRPSVFAINAAAIPVNNNFRDTPNSRTWDNVTIQKIGLDIAASAGLTLYYDSRKKVLIDYLEQSEQSDSAFLADLCEKYGLCYKVYTNKIVIFSEQEYELKAPIIQIKESDVTSWSAKQALTGTGYDGCILTYTSLDEEEPLGYAFDLVKNPKKILRINKDVSSIAEAEMVVKAELRRANKKQFTMAFSLPGNVNLIASSTVMVSGFGVFDGKYYIDVATHGVSGSGYVTQLGIHKVLRGGY